MIWTIARREFLEYLKSLRFLIGFLVTIALVALSTVINVSDYRERLPDYSTARKEMAGDTYPLIVALLILITHPAVALTGSDWISVLAMGFVSALYVQSLQFLILLLLSLILFLANGLLFARKYDQQTAWCSKRITAIREKPSTVSTELSPEPSPLGFIAEGGDNQALAGYTRGQMGVLRPRPTGGGYRR